jgi:hypothetical protein
MLPGCKNKFGQPELTEVSQGKVTYGVSYPDSAKYGAKIAAFPRTIILVFKGEKAVFVALGGMGMVQIVNLLDHKKKKYSSLLIDVLRGNYACTLTKDEYEVNEGRPEYSFELADGGKTIAGLDCKKAIFKDKHDNSTFECFYCEEIPFCYGNSAFKKFPFLFMEYTHTINQLTMKLTAQKVDFASPVDTSLFELKGNYTWVNQQGFYEHLNKL